MTPLPYRPTLLLLLLLAYLLNEVSSVLHGATIEKLDELFADYEVITPTLVDHEGAFLSHDLGVTSEAKFRRKRSSEEEVETMIVAMGSSILRSYNTSIDMRNDMYYPERNATRSLIDSSGYMESRGTPTQSVTFDPTPPSEAPQEFLHFNISAFGSELQLRVLWKKHLVAPGAKSVIFTSDGRRIEEDISSSCLLFGKVNKDPNSAVAINNCLGLAGLIKTSEGELFIEPLETPDDPEKPQRHVVYRRSAILNNANAGKRMDRVKRSGESRPNFNSLGNSLQSLLTNPIIQEHEELKRDKRHTKRNAYNMEIALVADSELVKFHGGEHVQKYLLTLINIVDEIYHDDSLGLHINIILTRIFQLDSSMSKRLIVSDQPKASLINSCKWADEIFTTDKTIKRRPDTSVFLTRSKFGPAGFAHISGMCDRLRSCSLAFEDGMSSSFVVAHEIGHILGMEHDGQGNKCQDETVMGSIMAPVVESAFHRYHWSRCSQQELRGSMHLYHCLNDDPHAPNWGPTPVYPGVAYSVDDQCRFNFGQGYSVCPTYGLPKCRALWCSHVENPLFCRRKSGPPADGTSCGENMWCFKGHCLSKDARQGVDGSWGEWSTYGDCSRTCGIGVMHRTRSCNRPAPANGGRDCVGQNMEPDLCSRRPCPSGKDFRAEQCTSKNSVTYKRERHKWLPYEHTSLALKCELFCVSKKKRNLKLSMGNIVEDGTPCSYEDPHGICIRGKCVDVGCDGVIGSPLREDACGVCNGDGSQCRNVTGTLSKRTRRRVNQYWKVYKIPKGARHIYIREMRTSNNDNILALKSREDRRYFINLRSRLITDNLLPYRIVNSGTLWTYDSQHNIEVIRAHGPTNSDVNLMVLVRSKQTRVEIAYNYVIHARDVPTQTSRHSYAYQVRKWLPCSASCGEGRRTARISCRSQSSGKWVAKRKCSGSAPSRSKICNAGPCPNHISWHAEQWSSCSRTCGFPGIQQRAVTCRRSLPSGGSARMDPSRCSSSMPDARKRCNPPPCPSVWKKGSWTRCSTTCGDGVQRRQVKCVPSSSAPSSRACLDPRPADVQACHLADCEQSECTSDTSMFCRLKAISSYCGIKGYRILCCFSCKKYRRQYGEAPGNIPPVQYGLSDAVSRLFGNSTLYGNNQSAFGNLTQLSAMHGGVYLHPQIRPNPPSQEDSSDSRDLNVDAEAALDDYDEDLDNGNDDQDSEDREVIQTLSPVNRTPSTPQTLLGAAGGTSSDNLNAARRRRRSLPIDKVTTIDDHRMKKPLESSFDDREAKEDYEKLKPKFMKWAKCRTESGCGLGSRHAIYGCWNERLSSWVTSSLCRTAPVASQKSACVVPCFIHTSHYRWRGFPARRSSACRELKGGFPGPRTHPSRCNYRGEFGSPRRQWGKAT